MEKTQPKNDVAANVIRLMFPDDNEREALLQSALVRLYPKPPQGDRLSVPVDVAPVVAEMLRIRRTRGLVQLIMAIGPKRMDGAEAMLGGCGGGALAEVAHVFGVSESTVVNDWIPAGMPARALIQKSSATADID